MKKVVIILALVFLLSLTFVSAKYIPYYVVPRVNGTLQPNVYFNFSINMSTTPDCSNIVVNHTEQNLLIGSDGKGHFNISLENMKDTPRFICEYRNGNFSNLRTIMNFSDMIFQDLYAQNINITTNVYVGENITINDFLCIGSCYNETDFTYLYNHTIGTINIADNKYLNLSGTNADQPINISPYALIMNRTIGDDGCSNKPTYAFKSCTTNDCGFYRIDLSGDDAIGVSLDGTKQFQFDDTRFGIKSSGTNFLTFITNIDTSLTADRNLNIDVNNAERTINLTGNPTLADWFDQNVKSNADVDFSGIEVANDIELDGDLLFGTITPDIRLDYTANTIFTIFENNPIYDIPLNITSFKVIYMDGNLSMLGGANISSNWFSGKINHSDVQNHPSDISCNSSGDCSGEGVSYMDYNNEGGFSVSEMNISGNLNVTGSMNTSGRSQALAYHTETGFIHQGDPDTFANFLTNEMVYYVGNADALHLKYIGPFKFVVINEGNNDIDFSVDTDVVEDYFKIDAGTNRTIIKELPSEPSTATSQYVCWDTDGSLFINETGC